MASAVLAPYLRRMPGNVVEQFAVELNLLGIHRNRLQAEMLDQLAQRIGAGHRVVVDLGNAGFVDRGRRIEPAGEDLAPEPIGRFKNGDAAEVAQFLLQIPRAHQAAGPAAYNCKIQHMFPVISGPRRRRLPAAKAPELSHFRRSAFFPEGKMNEAAQLKQIAKK